MNLPQKLTHVRHLAIKILLNAKKTLQDKNPGPTSYKNGSKNCEFFGWKVSDK